jgi:hypothetical protein
MRLSSSAIRAVFPLFFVVALSLVAGAITYPGQACFIYPPGGPGRPDKCNGPGNCSADQIVCGGTCNLGGRIVAMQSCDTFTAGNVEACKDYAVTSCKVLTTNQVCLSYTGYVAAANCTGAGCAGETLSDVNCQTIF